MNDDELEKAVLDQAEISNLLNSKISKLSPIGLGLAAGTLALWLDRTRLVGKTFFVQMDRAADAAEAQAAINTYGENLSIAAREHKLDLLTAIGEHIPDRSDERRQKIYLAISKGGTAQ
jgi:hypothetical protein